MFSLLWKKQLFPNFATERTKSESETEWSANYWNISLIILYPQILMSYTTTNMWERSCLNMRMEYWMYVQREHYDKFINEKCYESFQRVQIFRKKQ
jgi:hypothetical protein